ncbi:MAG TPA: hypothetical protein DCS83_08465 [Prevotella sp.]|nr:hypothetical protein [Prevotella sp.]
MNISALCFNDEEIKNVIDTVGHNGICECSGVETKVLDIDFFSDFFSDLLSVYQECPTSKVSLTDIIQRDWNLFNSTNDAEKIMRFCIIKYKPGLNPEHVSYINDILDIIALWDKIKYNLQNKSRYFTDLGRLYPSDPYLADFIIPDEHVVKGRKFYRSRVLPDRKAYYQKKDMGCPPPEKNSSGRANPIGISYLYLCSDRDTTFYEVRARYMDRVSIGEFTTNKDLDIVNFATKVSLYVSSHDGDIVKIIKRKLFLREIAKDLSKPLTRYDTELEYVPTQFICELCKINKADGICFESSLHKGGVNYVLFNGNDADCTDVSAISIDQVTINSSGKKH